MQLERISLVTVTLLLLTGCSANRQARQSDAAFDEPSPVSIPMQHPHEYDTDPSDYDFYPEEQESRRIPPAIPMREPVPAPPAIGISQVKSVSWLRRTDRSACAAERCGDGQIIGRQTQLPPEYFSNSCTEQPLTARSRTSRERLTLFEIIGSWNLRSKKSRPAPAGSRKRNAYVVRDSGCSDSEGCVSTGARASARTHGNVNAIDDHRGRGGSLADPLDEFGWENPTAADDQRFSPDELLDLQSERTSAPAKQSRPAGVPSLPVIEALPLIPMPEPVRERSELDSTHPPVAVPPQPESDAVKRIVQPPIWPRLIGPATKSVGRPQSLPERTAEKVDDSSLPMIQPGRRI